jgi:hypothetical protein
MPWIDSNGDGFHDGTGESRIEYERRAGRDADEERARDRMYSGADGPPPGGWYGEEDSGSPSSIDEANRRADENERAARDSDGGYGGYDDDPRTMTNTRLRVEEGNAHDEGSEGTFLYGDASGANARQARRRAAREAAEKQAWIDRAEEFAPSADDLWVQYEEEGNIAGPDSSELAGAYADEGAISIQRDALRQLQDVADDGLTEADRSRSAIAREAIGRDVRAQREADQQMLAQRGMSGSGQAVAALMGGQQAGASALSQADAQMQIEAQRRALQAMQAQGDLSGQMRGQSFGEETTRRGAADDFARYQTDYQRGREERNTGHRNRTRESRAQSRQQAYGNRERLAAMRTGQYGPTKDPSDVASESNDRMGGFYGGILSAALG